MPHPTLPGTPTPRERFSTLLWRLQSSRQWDRALAVAHEWLAQDPTSTAAHEAAGQALISLNRHQDALAHLEKVLAAQPGDGFAHRLASIACGHLSLADRAEVHVQEAIRLRPEDALNWYQLARLQYQIGAYPAAAGFARRARALDPNDANIVNLLALCERRQPAQQLGFYAQALQLDPENSAVLNNLGVSFLEDASLAGSRRAGEYFRRSLAVDPLSANAQRNLQAALRAGDPLYRVLRFFAALFDCLTLRHPLANPAGAFYALILWLCFRRRLIFIYGLWLVCGLPLVKGYEWITAPDVRAQAGIPGARRGGWLGFWRWPRWLRVCLLFAAWFALCQLALRLRDLLDPSIYREVWRYFFPAVFWLGAAVLCLQAGYALWQYARQRFALWRHRRKFPPPAPAPPPAQTLPGVNTHE